MPKQQSGLRRIFNTIARKAKLIALSAAFFLAALPMGQDPRRPKTANSDFAQKSALITTFKTPDIFPAPANDSSVLNYFSTLWFGVLSRQSMLLQANKKDVKRYNKFMDGFNHLKGKDLSKIADGIEGSVNGAVTYESDPDNYGKSEYWATPIETANSRRGDCEDYAILKYYALQYLGVPQDKFFLAVVNDPEGGAGINHCVLLFNVAKDGQPSDWRLLDNNNQSWVAPAWDKSNYTAYYAINLDGAHFPQDLGLTTHIMKDSNSFMPISPKAQPLSIK